jgi:hypothetical protein
MTLSSIDDELRLKEEEKIKADEKKSVQAAQDHLRLLNEKFMNSTNENTFLLNQLADLKERQLLSDKMLEKEALCKIKCDENSQMVDKEELINLRKKDRTQKMNIKALQAEIFKLKQKTGNFRLM